MFLQLSLSHTHTLYMVSHMLNRCGWAEFMCQGWWSRLGPSLMSHSAGFIWTNVAVSFKPVLLFETAPHFGAVWSSGHKRVCTQSHHQNSKVRFLLCILYLASLFLLARWTTFWWTCCFSLRTFFFTFLHTIHFIWFHCSVSSFSVKKKNRLY